MEVPVVAEFRTNLHRNYRDGWFPQKNSVKGGSHPKISSILQVVGFHAKSSQGQKLDPINSLKKSYEKTEVWSITDDYWEQHTLQWLLLVWGVAGMLFLFFLFWTYE